MTGNDQHNDGTLNVAVDVGSGYSWHVETTAVFAKGSTVLDACFAALLGVQVRGPTTDAWAGSVEASADGGTGEHQRHAFPPPGRSSTSRDLRLAALRGTAHACSSCWLPSGVRCQTVAVDV